MQLIVVLCLIAKLALVSGDCDVGKTVKDFDFTKHPTFVQRLTGTWYIMYHPSNEHDDNIACVALHADDPVGNVSAVVTYIYDKRARSESLIAGFAKDWDNTGFSTTYPDAPTWTGRLHISAVDYKSYVIFKLCRKNFDQSLLYVVFRSPHPDEKTLKKVEKILQDNNIETKQLASWDPDRCPKL